MQRRNGTASAEHLKFTLGVIDGPRFAKDNIPGRSPLDAALRGQLAY
jgi:hypothetical protein